MRFVNRLDELRRLNALWDRSDGGLVALWGRRRIGKTRLLTQWCRHHKGIYTVADQSSEPVQRRYFAEAVGRSLAGFDEAEYPSWQALLRALARRAKADQLRGPLVIDELPYLVAASPSLPSVLQRFVDHDAREARLVVAVAGSAQHMMQGLVMSATAPLFGRATEAMSLGPLSPIHMMEAIGLDSPVDCVRAFSVWGGVPRYWELAEPFAANLAESVDRLVLDPLGPLHLEPDRLLADDVPSAVSLRPLLDAIGAGCHRLSEIAGRLEQPATSLSRPLTRLADLGFVVREQPFGASERGGKRTLYRIADPFLRLWFRVVAPRRGLLATVPASARIHTFEAHRPALMAETWEELCRRAVPHLPPDATLHLESGPFGPASRFWRGSGPEWDVVAESLDGRTLLLGEVKWHEKPADEDATQRAIADLLRKGDPSPSLVGSRRLRRAVFAPAFTPAAKRKRWPVDLVDAATVLGSAAERA
jgi:hypothetical protein